MDLRNEKVAIAIAALERRAERQASDLTLFNTYVDIGVLQEISETESQVIYGRRGVGKTHLLHYHHHAVLLSGKRILYEIFDCQLLGSGTATLTDDPKVVAHNYAFEFLTELGARLFDAVTALKLDKTTEERSLNDAINFVDFINSKDGSFDYRNLSKSFESFCDHTGFERGAFGVNS